MASQLAIYFEEVVILLYFHMAYLIQPDHNFPPLTHES